MSDNSNVCVAVLQSGENINQLKQSCDALLERIKNKRSVSSVELHPQTLAVDKHEARVLLLALYMELDDNMIKLLFRHGLNVNIQDVLQRTPLHFAIQRPTTAITEELIKMGADINAQDDEGFTPVHYAAMHSFNNLRLLLNSGAGAYIKSNCGLSPLVCALYCKNYRCIEVLMNCYDYDYSCEAVSCYFNNFNNAFRNLVLYAKSKVFKLIWTHLDSIRYVDLWVNFMVTYLMKCNYSNAEWVKCLHLILDSDCTREFFRKHQTDIYKAVDFDWEVTSRGRNLLQIVLKTLYLKKIDPIKRVGVISKLLNLGLGAYMNDFNLIIQIYGIGRELDCLINAPCSYKPYDNGSTFPLTVFITGIESDFREETIKRLFVNQILYSSHVDKTSAQKHTIFALGFFWLSQLSKARLLKCCRIRMDDCSQIENKLNIVPEFPSLLELSRNEIHKIINHCQTCKINGKIIKPSRFHSAVKQLNLPDKLADVVCFKVPIY